MNGIFLAAGLHKLFLLSIDSFFEIRQKHILPLVYITSRAAPKKIFDSAVRRNFPGKFKTFGSELTK